MISKSKRRQSLICQNSCQTDWLYKNQWHKYVPILPVALTSYPIYCFVSILESLLFALTNDIKMNKRKWLYDDFNYDLQISWFLKQKTSPITI